MYLITNGFCRTIKVEGISRGFLINAFDKWRPCGNEPFRLITICESLDWMHSKEKIYNMWNAIQPSDFVEFDFKHFYEWPNGKTLETLLEVQKSSYYYENIFPIYEWEKSEEEIEKINSLSHMHLLKHVTPTREEDEEHNIWVNVKSLDLWSPIKESLLKGWKEDYLGLMLADFWRKRDEQSQPPTGKERP